MCLTSLQLSSRIFWIGVKFHSNSCRCSDTWLTEQPELTVILAQNCCVFRIKGQEHSNQIKMADELFLIWTENLVYNTK